MSNSNPLVTIVCFAYNHERYLKDTLEGFVKQKTDFSFEIVIHDDASTDGTPDIIRDYERRYPQLFRPIYQSENQASQEKGRVTKIVFSAVRGEYIATCEGDDYWTDPEKLQKQIDQFRAHPQATFCFHIASKKWETTDRQDSLIGDYGSVAKIIPLEDVILRGANFCATNAVMLKKSAAQQVVDLGISGSYYQQVLGAGEYGAIYIPDNMSVYRKMTVGSWSERSKRNDNFLYTHNLAFFQDLKKLRDFIAPEYKKYVGKVIDERANSILGLVGIDKKVRGEFYRKEKKNLFYKTKLKWLFNYYDLKK